MMIAKKNQEESKKSKFDPFFIYDEKQRGRKDKKMNQDKKTNRQKEKRE